MKTGLMGAVWRLAVFVVVCVTGIAALFAIFAQLRFFDERHYLAVFSNVSGLANGNFVRVAGVEIGKVKAISLADDATVTVEFSAEPSVVMTEGTRAVIRYDNLIGGRYLALEQGPGDGRVLPPGGTIPLARTAPALDLDALTGGFRPLFRALNPDQVNALTQQLISAFQGEGAAMGSLLNQLSAVTGTLADRDALIGEVVTNLDTVLASLGKRSGQLDKTVTSLSQLVEELSNRRQDISTGIAYTDAAAAATADLLGRARPAIAEDVTQSERVAGAVLSDKDYFDQVLDTLPDKYRLLGRQGLYGDYFSFYLCDAVLKMNGKGGQPVYIKVAGQSTGRCAPK